MALRKILEIPDQRLREKALPINKVDDRIRLLMDDMYETMKLNDRGIGLAANQVGVLERVIVVDLGPDYQSEPFFMANPEIIALSQEVTTITDGCLSIPDLYAKTDRADKITVRYLDRQNRPRELEASGIVSACIQHEIDHLNGILFIDHLSPLKRKLALAKVIKTVKKKKS